MRIPLLDCVSLIAYFFVFICVARARRTTTTSNLSATTHLCLFLTAHRASFSPFPTARMPQGIHKPARRSERTSKSSQGSNSASRKSHPRPIFPAYLTQSERATIEHWKEGVSEGSVHDARETMKYDAVVQAYVAAKLRLFQISLVKEKAESAQSDTASNSSTRS